MPARRKDDDDDSLTSLPQAIQLERILTLKQAAEMTNMSVQTWRKEYSHLIVRLTKRKIGVKLKDVLSIGKRPPKMASRA